MCVRKLIFETEPKPKRKTKLSLEDYIETAIDDCFEDAEDVDFQMNGKTLPIRINLFCKIV